VPAKKPDPVEILFESHRELDRKVGALQDKLASLSERLARLEGRESAADKIEDRRVNRKLITATYVVGLISAVAIAITFTVDVIGRILKWWS